MKPIIFSTPMIQAILSGRKTQTRRLVKGDALKFLNAGFTSGFVSDPGNHELCPFLDIEDSILWVRESYVYVVHDELLEGMDSRIVYRASVHEDWMESAREKGYKWKPSIHMPRQICRIFLKVSELRIERLNDISENDAIEEGIDYAKGDLPSLNFGLLWESIHGLGSWIDNPWVWVIKFERIRI